MAQNLVKYVKIDKLSIYNGVKDREIQGIRLQFKVSLSGDRIFNRVISDISVVLRETTLFDSINTGSSVETEIVVEVSLNTTEITETTRFKNPIFRVRIP